MCEYCENEKEKPIDIFLNGETVFVYDDLLVYSFKDKEIELPINYCPMCGKKL